MYTLPYKLMALEKGYSEVLYMMALWDVEKGFREGIWRRTFKKAYKEGHQRRDVEEGTREGM